MQYTDLMTPTRRRSGSSSRNSASGSARCRQVAEPACRAWRRTPTVVYRFVAMPSWSELVTNHPSNASLARYFAPRHGRREQAVVARPEDVEHPYYGLGTHPDLVARLWDELGKVLEVDCRAVF